MLPFPAINLLAFLYLGACMEPIAVQQPFNLAVRPAGGKEFKWNFFFEVLISPLVYANCRPTPPIFLFVI